MVSFMLCVLPQLKKMDKDIPKKNKTTDQRPYEYKRENP